MSGGVDRWRRGGVTGHLEGVDEEPLVAETCVPLTTLGVEDPERRRPPRRTVAVVRDECLRALADDVAAQADPRPTSQLEADAGRLIDRSRKTAGGLPATAAAAGRIEDQEQGLRASGERGESMESIGDPRRRVRLRQATAGQVEDEHVHRTAGQERARDAQALIQAGRGDDDEPFEPDAAGDGLDRVEAARQVQPGDDGALRLGLGGHPERQGRPAAGAVTPDRDAGRTRETARTQDRIERGEAGLDDATVGEWRDHREWRLGLVRLRRHRCQRERPRDPRSCGTPAGLEARDGGVHITTGGRHRTSRLEHLF